MDKVVCGSNKWFQFDSIRLRSDWFTDKPIDRSTDPWTILFDGRHYTTHKYSAVQCSAAIDRSIKSNQINKLWLFVWVLYISFNAAFVCLFARSVVRVGNPYTCSLIFCYIRFIHIRDNDGWQKQHWLIDCTQYLPHHSYLLFILFWFHWLIRFQKLLYQQKHVHTSIMIFIKQNKN